MSKNYNKRFISKWHELDEELNKRIPHDDVFLRTFGSYQSKHDIRYAQGKAHITPSAGLVVGSRINFQIIYQAEYTGITRDGSVKFAFPRTWSPPQLHNRNKEGFVIVLNPLEDETELRVTQWRHIEWYITAILRRSLRGGECIRIEYRNVIIQRFPQKTWDNWRSHLEVFVDQQATGDYHPLRPENRYALEIVNGPICNFNLVIPACTVPDKSFNLKIGCLDVFNNFCQLPYVGSINFYCYDPQAKLPKDYVFTREDKGTKTFSGIKFSKEGVFRIRIKDRKRQIDAESNPSQSRGATDSYNLYFGDIHGQSGFSCGLGSPEEYYGHARDVAGSDFCSLTDNSGQVRGYRECARADNPAIFRLLDEAWEYIKEVGNRYNQPGRFVTIIGIENFQEPPWGHRNIYYPDDAEEQPVFSGHSLFELWSFLEGKEALVIPHNSLFEMKWDFHNPHFEKLVEIYSMWGCSERRDDQLWNKGKNGISCQELLASGAKLGFVAASDNHHGRPGIQAHPSRMTNICYQGGLTAVYAEELTREKIYKALKERRCYATTGTRIILDLKINGHVMGSILSLATERSHNRDIKVKVVGTAEIRQVDVVRDNKNIYSDRPSSDIADFQYCDEEPPELVLKTSRFRNSRAIFYYARVTQHDGNMAWSSPIWIEQRNQS